MAIRNPEIMPLGDEGLVPGRRTHEWFEIELDEFKVQKRLPCFVDEERFWVEPQVWDEWQRELVEYFINNNYKGPEIDEFIKNHALGGTGKVERS